MAGDSTRGESVRIWDGPTRVFHWALVALVALQLEDTATRMAQLVGAMQHELQTRFGDDLAEARQYLMQEPESADA